MTIHSLPPITPPEDTASTESTALRRSSRLKGEAPEFDGLQPRRRKAVSGATSPRRTNSLPASQAPDSEITRAYRQAPMPTDMPTLRRIHTDAQLANWVYTRRPESLPGDWAPATELLSQACGAMDPPLQAQVDGGVGTVVDTSTGLVASVLANPTTHEVVVAFGGTSAGPTAADAAKRVVGNFGTMSTQWKANIAAGLGILPASYAQAAALVAALQAVVGQGQGPWANHTLRTVGHSKGGGEASFAALFQPVPVRADVFAPNHLSTGLIDLLPFDNVWHAVDLVRCYTVETDAIPALRNVPLGGVDGVGTEHFIPVDVPTGSSLLSVHKDFVQHLEGHMRRCESAEPSGE